MHTRQKPPKFEGHTPTQTGVAFSGKVEGGPVLEWGETGYVIVEVTVADVQHPRRADGAMERLHKLTAISAIVVDEEVPDEIRAWLNETRDEAALEADRMAGREPLPIEEEG